MSQLTASQIFDRLGGHRSSNGWMCHCPGPMHKNGDQNPSLSVWTDSSGRGAWHCRAGCSWHAVRDALERRCSGAALSPASTARPAVNRVSREHTEKKLIDPADEKELDRILRECEDVSPQCLAATYLRERCLDHLIGNRALFFHPKLMHWPSRKCWPALITVVENPLNGEPMTIWRTYLTRDGSSKLKILNADGEPMPASMAAKGMSPMGGVAMLWSDPEPEAIAIGEGIESSASAGVIWGLPAWAAMSAGNLATLELPRYVRRIHIAVDHDPAGIKAANAARSRWVSEGRHVEARLPVTGPDTDFNDVLMARFKPETISKGAVA